MGLGSWPYGYLIHALNGPKTFEYLFTSPTYFQQKVEKIEVERIAHQINIPLALDVDRLGGENSFSRETDFNFSIFTFKWKSNSPFNKVI